MKSPALPLFIASCMLLSGAGNPVFAEDETKKETEENPDDGRKAMEDRLAGQGKSQEEIAEMIRQGDGGRIVSISSVHSYRAWPHDTVYGIVKAGLNRMALSLAVDLAGHNINVNCVAPGYIDSRVLPLEEEASRGKHAEDAMPWIPNRRGGLPTDIANAVLFLSSPMSDYVNGQTLTVDGGFLAGGTPE